MGKAKSGAGTPVRKVSKCATGEPFTPEQEQFIIDLRELSDDTISWAATSTKFNMQFPTTPRSKGALQVHYSRSLQPNKRKQTRRDRRSILATSSDIDEKDVPSLSEDVSPINGTQQSPASATEKTIKDSAVGHDRERPKRSQLKKVSYMMDEAYYKEEENDDDFDHQQATETAPPSAESSPLSDPPPSPRKPSERKRKRSLRASDNSAVSEAKSSKALKFSEPKWASAKEDTNALLAPTATTEHDPVASSVPLATQRTLGAGESVTRVAAVGRVNGSDTEEESLSPKTLREGAKSRQSFSSNAFQTNPKADSKAEVRPLRPILKLVMKKTSQKAVPPKDVPPPLDLTIVQESKASVSTATTTASARDTPLVWLAIDPCTLSADDKSIPAIFRKLPPGKILERANRSDSIRLRSLRVGELAPDFSCQKHKRSSKVLEQLTGKIVEQLTSEVA